MLKSVALLLFIVFLLILETRSHIYLDDNIKDCDGIDCENGGTLDDTSCRCICSAGFTGHFCDSEMKTSAFPRGNYALPSSLVGCPEDDDSYGWMTGFINLTLTDYLNETVIDFDNLTLINSISRNRHYWSEEIHLLGPYHRRTVQLNFCSRVDNQLLNHKNKNTDTIWPAGEYCLYKVGDVCPKGFTEGFIHLESYVVLQGMYDGTLPDVNFTSDGSLTLSFCCNHGNGNYSNTENKVSFGKTSHFFLFKGQNAAGCIDIADMDSQQEMFAFRKSEKSKWPTSGSVPYHAEDDIFFNITFCYYKPSVQDGCMYLADRGASYRGSYNIPKIGKTCAPWDSIQYLDPRYAADLEKNHCRRLSKAAKFPGCMVNQKRRSCEGMPICSKSNSKF